jgi:hypothetical protein
MDIRKQLLVYCEEMELKPIKGLDPSICSHGWIWGLIPFEIL